MLALAIPGVTFAVAQSIAVIVAMTSNFFINNAITYRDAKLKGFGPLLRGLLYFYVVCAFGAVANVGVATLALQPLSGGLALGPGRRDHGLGMEFHAQFAVRVAQGLT